MRAARRWPLPTLTPVMKDDDRKQQLSFAIFWAMRERGVTPPKLGKAIGKSPDTIRRWMDGEGAPNALDLAPLAAALGLRVDYFTHPPDVPAYPFADYETTDPPTLEKAESSGIDEGLRRADGPRVRPVLVPPTPSTPRRPRGSEAKL